jgi:hypothetical protein
MVEITDDNGKVQQITDLHLIMCEDQSLVKMIFHPRGTRTAWVHVMTAENARSLGESLRGLGLEAGVEVPIHMPSDAAPDSDGGHHD